MPAELPKTHQKSKTIYESSLSSQQLADGVTVEYGVSSATCGAESVTMGRFTLLSGAQLPMHRHIASEEAGYVIDGSVELSEAEGLTLVAETGAFYYVPKGTAHRLRNAGSEPARVIFVHPLISEPEQLGTERA
jgi:quercetin dioxygenase-like cupin family protein